MASVLKTARSVRFAEVQAADPQRPLQLLPPASVAESKVWTLVDLAVYAFILLVGVFQITHYPHATDFLSDMTYPDLARSLLEKGSYELRFVPQTVCPPGFPLILAGVGSIFGLTPAALFGVVAVSAALGLLVTFEFLRRVAGRGLASAVALLLASSPVLFGFNTVIVYPEMSYFLMSMLVLLLALKIDQQERAKSRLFLVLLLAVALVAAVMIRSVGVALLAGLVTWIAASMFITPATGHSRLRQFAIPLLLASVAQISWMVWASHHQTIEWQLPGYPESYISQLRVKNGHHPELGTASLRDIPERISRNVISRTAGFSQLLLRRNITKFWSSPAICGLLILIGFGLISSLRNGGQLHDWYFLWHELIFLLWPWDYRDRFLIPIVPLACLYIWRGAKTVSERAIRKPRIVGWCFVFTGSLLCISSALFVRGVATFPLNPEHVRGDHLQTIAATLFWAIVALIGLGTLNANRLRRLPDRSNSLASTQEILQLGAVRAVQFIAVLAVAGLVISGSRIIVSVGRQNLHPDVTKQDLYPLMKAAEWIRTSEPSDRIVMAREPDLLFHYLNRRTVWFPPISNASVLMDGIRRHHVGAILIVHQAQSYWLPSDEECFSALQQAYPNAFRLAHQDSNIWLYEVSPPVAN